MIRGIVKADEARISLEVMGFRMRLRETEAVIDTGYTGFLTLPPAMIVELGLRWKRVDRSTLADGSECLFDVYEAKVIWDNKERRIFVDEADTDPLVGMAMLKDYELKMQVRSRGKITISRLPK
jgi:clan AA aspartic protease